MSSMEIEHIDSTKNNDDDVDISPIEQVRVIVSNEDDPTLPVWTFRMWFMGLISVVLLSFLNTFFSYRTEPLTVTMISVQVATLPIGRFMAKVGNMIYGVGFAFIASTISNVAFFNGRSGKEDIHTRLMKKYKDIPNWWFLVMLLVSFIVALVLVTFMKDQVQLPWWALIFAAAFALFFTPFISIITATTNQLGHYMKIPPRSMFLVQTIGTIIAGTINVCVAWWMLSSIKNICNTDLLPPSSEWTCPGDRVFFDASVIWGLVGPWRILGPKGNYPQLNLFFFVGAIGPGINWWHKYNYVLSGALDAGMAFMLVLLYFTLNMEGKSLSWLGQEEHCDLAKCPTAKGINVTGCPVF
ncbi:hypothetical protein TanjilG_28469 [Lupinus angustifolius]|uniref:Uncharacterized protein n=1 Tax=Lupinus angustifolius TaxID=3871 RepID=A0A1J7H4E5_LUPAN|nr:hypothetical protein TanjilG_28469 [Lupinus angustifolius]